MYGPKPSKRSFGRIKIVRDPRMMTAKDHVPIHLPFHISFYVVIME